MNPKRRRRNRIIAILVTLAVLAAIIFGVLKYVQYKNDRKTVNVVPVMNVSTTYWGDEGSSSGIIESDNVQEIYPDYNRSVSEIFVEQGQPVHIGDPLLQFDKDELELDVEFKRVAVLQAELDVDTAQKQLKKLQNTKPATTPTAPPPIYVPVPGPTQRPSPTQKPTVTPTPAPSIRPADVTLYSRLDYESVPYKGSGTTDDPYVFLVTDDCIVTPGFLKLLLGMETPPEPVATPTPEPDDGEGSESGEEGNGPDDNEDEPFVFKTPFAAVFEVREGDSNYGRLKTSFKLDGTDISGAFISAGALSNTNTLESVAGMFGPKATATPMPTQKPSSDNYNDMGYTADQLKELINEKKEEIQTLQLAQRQAELDFNKANRMLKNSTVLSTIDGVVRTLTTPEQAMADGTPFLVVSGENTFYVHGAVSESYLGAIDIGTVVTVMDYMSGGTYTANVIGIADYPVDSDSGLYYYGLDNPNSSVYEFVAVINNDGQGLNLQNGSGVNVTFEISNSDSADALYLYKPYIREDESGSYIMKAGYDNRLVKQYIQEGKTIYNGEYVEIKSGLTMNDYVAFPYGTDVKEGVRVVVEGSDRPPYADDEAGTIGNITAGGFDDGFDNGFDEGPETPEMPIEEEPALPIEGVDEGDAEEQNMIDGAETADDMGGDTLD